MKKHPRSQIRKLRARRRENRDLREKLVHAFTYKYLKLLSSALVCVPNKNLTNKFVTLNAIVILKNVQIFRIYYKIFRYFLKIVKVRSSNIFSLSLYVYLF